MDLQFISLADVIDRALLDCYLEEVGGLSCSVFDPRGKRVLAAGIGEAAPVPAIEELVEIASTPLPVDVKGGRAAGLFAKGELVGYVSVSLPREQDLAAADFVFQLINYAISQQLERESLEFTSDYLKNLITLMQGMSQKAAAVFDKKKVAELFVLECEKLFGARSGAVLVHENGEARVLAAFGADFDDWRAVEAACARRKMLVSNAPLADPLYEGRTLPINMMTVPLCSGQELVGALYLRDKQMGPFTIEDQRMAETLGTVLGGTISNIQLHQSLVATERVKSTLSRYLSPNLLKEVVEGGSVQTLGGRRVHASIFFADIRGFTKISEQVSPEQMVAQLNEYFEEMAQVIFRHDGTLDKYVGDLIMVLFGAPKAMPDAAARAIKTAVEMQRRIGILNKKWLIEGKPAFGVGMGINSGEVVFGNIGSSQAMGLTVIGDHVNAAQRLEAYAGAGEILVSEAVYNEVRGSGFEFDKLGLVEVKGKQIVAYCVKYE